MVSSGLDRGSVAAGWLDVASAWSTDLMVGAVAAASPTTLPVGGPDTTTPKPWIGVGRPFDLRGNQ
jgi:hypothetical protein